MRKSELINFLNEYDEDDYEVRVIDDYGHEATVETVDWANGPWIVIKGVVVTDDRFMTLLHAEGED